MFLIFLPGCNVERKKKPVKKFMRQFKKHVCMLMKNWKMSEIQDIQLQHTIYWPSLMQYDFLCDRQFACYSHMTFSTCQKDLNCFMTVLA
jgi:hypothetical protein